MKMSENEILEWIDEKQETLDNTEGRKAVILLADINYRLKEDISPETKEKLEKLKTQVDSIVDGFLNEIGDDYVKRYIQTNKDRLKDCEIAETMEEVLKEEIDFSKCFAPYGFGKEVYSLFEDRGLLYKFNNYKMSEKSLEMLNEFRDEIKEQMNSAKYRTRMDAQIDFFERKNHKEAEKRLEEKRLKEKNALVPESKFATIYKKGRNNLRSALAYLKALFKGKDKDGADR